METVARGWNNSLVVAEVAFSVMLLVTAGLLVRSFWKISRVDPGFDPREVLTAQLAVPTDRYSQEKIAEFYRELLERLQRVPGVRGAAATNILPLSGNHSCDAIRVDAHPAPGGQNPCAETGSVSLEYFRVMSIPILRGRQFEERDNASAPKVVIVNQAMADWLWRGEDPIGQTLTVVSLGVSERPRTIIAVAGNTVHSSFSEPPVPQYYIPQSQPPYYPAMTLVVRGTDPHSLITPVREQVTALDANVPLYNARAFSELIDMSVSRPRFQALLFGAFGILALALACGGVYGVIAHSVSRRVYEFGVRTCVGATSRDIAWLLARENLAPVILGSAIGIGGSIGSTQWVSALLFGIHPLDGPSFVIAPAIIVIVSTLAMWGPIRRAARFDPVIALRAE